jgi:hypothetical protein
MNGRKEALGKFGINEWIMQEKGEAYANCENDFVARSLWGLSLRPKYLH